jgi:hypothetical protein
MKNLLLSNEKMYRENKSSTYVTKLVIFLSNILSFNQGLFIFEFLF